MALRRHFRRSDGLAPPKSERRQLPSGLLNDQSENCPLVSMSGGSERIEPAAVDGPERIIRIVLGKPSLGGYAL